MGDQPLSLIQHMKAGLRRQPPAQKGLRTRERLKIATAEILERKGYLAMRPADITKRAGLAEGSFYMYFKDKTAATLAVLTSLLEDFMLLGNQAIEPKSPFEVIQHANRQWLATARANSGLMRCVLQLGDENPDFAELVQRSNRRWYTRVAKSVARQRGIPEEGPILLVVYVLGGMMDELLRKLVIYPDRELLALLRELDGDDDLIADAASLMWVRLLYPQEPLPATLTAAAATLANLLGGVAPNRARSAARLTNSRKSKN
jgi:TetR/AcrR family transcriptional regulator, transcriptional repressor for nem operon